MMDHLNTDVNQLILNPPSEFKDRIKFLAAQILSRQKAKGKLNQWVQNEALIFPPPLSIEQSSSEITSNYKGSIISGHHLVDLTGGMGIDCLAMSGAFKRTTYVERDTNLCEIFSHNAAALGKEIEVVNETAENYLDSFSNEGEATFFIDPARRDSHANKVFRFSECSPDLTELLESLKSKAHKVLVKASQRISQYFIAAGVSPTT